MTKTTLAQNSVLYGYRILVAEDEYLIVQGIIKMLMNAGAEILGPVPSVRDAESLIATENRIDGALLDVNLGSETIWTVVDHLLARRVPLVLATGYDASVIPPNYSHLPRCEKPVRGPSLIDLVAQTLSSSALM